MSAYSRELSVYTDLKIYITNLNLTLQQFATVKLLFKRDINSVRAFYKITNLASLLDTLERRAVLSEQRIDPFDVIAKYLKDTHLETLLNQYRKYLQDNNLVADPNYVINVYELETKAAGSLLDQEYRRLNKHKEYSTAADAEEVLVNDDDDNGNYLNPPLLEDIAKQLNLKSSEAAPPQTDTYRAVTHDEKRAIFNLIAREIGKKWRDFGRGLELGEGDLDEIEVKFASDLKSRILELLHRFANDNPPEANSFIPKIMCAVSLARRNDLKREILKILNK